MKQHLEDELPPSTKYVALVMALAAVALIMTACLGLAHAQAIVSPTGLPANAGTTANPLVVAPSGGLLPTNGVQTCGTQATPITTFNAVGQTASLNCPGAGSYDVRIIPTSGAPLVGTFTSADLAQPNAPSGRRLYKNGVGPLELSTESLTSTNTSPVTYRTNGGDNLTITLTSYTSGSAQIYISASYTAPMVLLNGSIDTREEAALRQGKAFTASSGLRSVASGSNEEILLTNPANSGVRLVIPQSNRIFTCDNVSSAQLPKWTSIPNPTTNLPTVSITPTRRGGVSGTSAATVLSDVLTTTPSGGSGPTFPVGGAFFASYVITQDRTLEPGNSIMLYITGVAVPTGLTTTTSSCSIIISWFEESLN